MGWLDSLKWESQAARGHPDAMPGRVVQRDKGRSGVWRDPPNLRRHLLTACASRSTARRWRVKAPGVNCQERTKDEILKSLRVTLQESLEDLSHDDLANLGDRVHARAHIPVKC